MKVATIAPFKEMERFTGEDQFHLALAHFRLVPGYTQFYASPQRGYVILDNGAYEVAAGTGIMPSWRDMITTALVMNCAEIVLPDVMLDGVETFRQTHAALQTVHNDLPLDKVRMMFVPHGNDIREWLWCMHRILWEFEELRQPGDLDPVIGVAKIYDTKFEHGRLPILQTIEEMRVIHPFDVHLLGFTRLWQLAAIGKWIQEGRFVGRTDWVRSTDTGKAVTYGIERKRMSIGEAQIMHRQEDYFNLTLDDEQATYTRWNIDLIQRTANGVYP